MFEAKLTESGVLKKVLDAIKELLNEASFDCSDQGIQLQAMDTSHVCLVSLNLRAEEFESYRCDRSLSMGMNLESFVKILKCSNNDDGVVLRSQDNSDVISFSFESRNGEKVSDFDMKLINLDVEHLGIPDTNYDCVIKMPSSDFAKIVRDLSQFGESITINCSKQGVQFSATGEIGTGNVKLAQSTTADDERKSIRIDLAEPVILSFASKYLTNFAKAAGLSDRVSLSMCSDLPLVVEFKVMSGETEYGYLRFYLAPKIEDDD